MSGLRRLSFPGIDFPQINVLQAEVLAWLQADLSSHMPAVWEQGKCPHGRSSETGGS